MEEVLATNEFAELTVRVGILMAVMLQSFSNSEQLNSSVIQDGLIAAMNRLLNSDCSHGSLRTILRTDADAEAEIKRLLVAAPGKEF